MIKKIYFAPEADVQEMENAIPFLAESNGGSIDELQDSRLDIIW